MWRHTAGVWDRSHPTDRVRDGKRHDIVYIMTIIAVFLFSIKTERHTHTLTGTIICKDLVSASDVAATHSLHNLKHIKLTPV